MIRAACHRLLSIALPLAALAACSPPPDLPMAVSPAARAAPYPRIVPLEPLLARAAQGRLADPATGAAVTDTLARRAEALQRRADALSRAPVLSPADRTRLQTARPVDPGPVLTPEERARLQQAAAARSR
jgi:hypothetical protein